MTSKFTRYKEMRDGGMPVSELRRIFKYQSEYERLYQYARIMEFLAQLETERRHANDTEY